MEVEYGMTKSDFNSPWCRSDARCSQSGSMSVEFTISHGLLKF